MCDTISASLTQTARYFPALRHRIIEDVNASLQKTNRDPSRLTMDDIGPIVYLQQVVPEIQALQYTDDGKCVNGECVASTCTRTHAKDGSDLFVCSVCQIAQYCSKECQKQ